MNNGQDQTVARGRAKTWMLTMTVLRPVTTVSIVERATVQGNDMLE